MSDRYCYVMNSIEDGVVDVYSGKEEAINEGIKYAETKGVLESEVVEVNEDYTIIYPKKYDVYEKVEISRFRIK